MRHRPVADNRRRLTRHPLGDELAVWLPDLDAAAGRAVNVHREGLMLLGGFRFDENRLYRLRLLLPEGFPAQADTTFGVDCLWVRFDEEEGVCWSGFQIIDASDAQLQLIDQIVTRLT